MTSYAGFYVTPQAWADWLQPRTTLPVAAAVAELLIQKELRKKKLGDHLIATMVPKPLSEPGELEDLGLILYRRWSKKRKYLSPRADSKLDLQGPQILERWIGLKVTEWRTIWYNGQSTEPPYEAEFLNPPPPKGEDKPQEKEDEEPEKNNRKVGDDKKVRFEDDEICMGGEGDTDSKNWS